MSSKDHVQHELAIARLSNKERRKPYLVINSFFSYADLNQVRAYLWLWLKTAVTGGWHKLSGRERHDALYFYEQLGKLVEAAYLLRSSKQE